MVNKLFIGSSKLPVISPSVFSIPLKDTLQKRK
jgi:hypothetical protein